MTAEGLVGARARGAGAVGPASATAGSAAAEGLVGAMVRKWIRAVSNSWRRANIYQRTGIAQAARDRHDARQASDGHRPQAAERAAT